MTKIDKGLLISDRVMIKISSIDAIEDHGSHFTVYVHGAFFPLFTHRTQTTEAREIYNEIADEMKRKKK